MQRYTAHMKHNEETFYRLSKVQYDTFGKPTKMTLLAFCAIWVYLGIASNLSVSLKLICLMIGCFCGVSLNYPPKWNAEKWIRQLDGRELATDYEFGKDGVRCSAPGEETNAAVVPYAKLLALVEDAQYCYLFISKHGAYMVDKSTIAPDDMAQFRADLQQAVNKPWMTARRSIKESNRRLPQDGNLRR